MTNRQPALEKRKDEDMAEPHVVKPDLAARIEGIDAARPDPQDIAFLRASLQRYPVVVLPDQHLSEEDQLAFGRLFGELDRYDYASDDYNPGQRAEILSVSNAEEGETPAEALSRRRMLDLGNKLWHSDSSFKQIPAHLSMLYGVRVTTQGGETQFADLRAGYDALDPDMQRLIEGLVAEHSIVHSRSALGFDDWNAEFRSRYGAWAAHPIVRTLPETGRKTLYLSAHASHIVGLPVPIGRMLLHELTEAATAPDMVYTHHWTERDLVIWDNRCTMHRLRRYRASAEPRTLRRVTTTAPEFPAVDPATVTVPDWVLDEAA